MAEPKTAGESKAAEPEEAIEVERLVAESRGFLGVPPHVAAGALSGVTKSSITVADAKKRVDKWLETEVKVDEGEGG